MTFQFNRRIFSAGTGALALAGFSARPARAAIVPPSLKAPSLNTYNFKAVGNGVADETQSFQNLAAASSGQRMLCPSGRYLLPNNGAEILLGDNTIIQGDGFGTVIAFHGSNVFKNSGWHTGVANRGIVFRDLVFDGEGLGSTPISLIGVNNILFDNVHVINCSPNNVVSAGFGFGATPTLPCSDIKCVNSTLDVPDYGLVFDSGVPVPTAATALVAGLTYIIQTVGSTDFTTVGAASNTVGVSFVATGVASGSGVAGATGIIDGVIIAQCNITTHFGTCISLAHNVQDVAVSACNLYVPGDSPTAPNAGIGIKAWSGYGAKNAVNSVTVTGTTLRGNPVNPAGLFAFAMNNDSYNIITHGCIAIGFSQALNNDFAFSGTNFVWADNIVDQCTNGIIASNSSDSHISVVGGVFSNITTAAIDVGVDTQVIAAVRFANIGGNAITGETSNLSVISASQFSNIGRSAVKLDVRGGGSNSLCVLSGLSMDAIATSADNTYAVIDLNDQPNVISGCGITNPLGGNLPSYIINRLSGSNSCIMSGIWMFGARQGYVQNGVGVTDVYAINLERGGIG